MNVLSYHLCIETDNNRVVRSDEPSPADIEAMACADAVILPQGCRESFYVAARRACPHVFPDYEVCFSYPGKIGQAALFRKMKVLHPLTFSFQNIEKFSGVPLPFPYPFVFKSSWGGEGNNVFLVESEDDLHCCLERAAHWQRSRRGGFLLQEYVHAGGRSLRVVVIGSDFYPYWRRVESGGFYTNLAKGAIIDRESFPHLQERAVAASQDFCAKTGINLAGFDFLFDFRVNDPAPFFLEINFCFRCKGLGGVDAYHRYLEKGIREWLRKINRIKLA
ncbi:MAG: glutathione synthase [Pseudomonadota bacterium]